MILSKLKPVIKTIPGAKKVYSLLSNLNTNYEKHFLKYAPPGHFYSPIPNIDYVRKNRDVLFSRERTSIPGIDINSEKQTNLIKELSAYLSEIPFSEEQKAGIRYYFNNTFFGHGSSIVLYSVMRHFKPQQIVEVGSGFSSAAMLDVNDKFFDSNISLTFIEPYPKRLQSLLSEKDRNKCKIYVNKVQHIPLSVMTNLKENDILFIDSSHVAKIGSDVLSLVTEILPILKKGVIIHIHDIYWPFEYPEDWINSGIAWNEAYMVKSFLQFNNSFEILLFNSYLSIHQRRIMNEYLPGFLPDGGSSLWLRKMS